MQRFEDRSRETGRDPENDGKKEDYRELLDELRTVIPGVQVLFAFLLTAPFAARFEQLDMLGKVVFGVALLANGIAIALFLAPVAYHRLAGRHDRRERLRFGIKTAVAGLLLLAAAVCCAVFVVTRFLFDAIWLAAATTAVIACLVGGLWVLAPLAARRGSRKRE